MKYILFLGWVLIIQLSIWINTSAQQPVNKNHQEIALWLGIPPGSENLVLKESIQERSADLVTKNRAISNIRNPSMEMYIPENPNGVAVLICPGGGYSYLSYDKEGVDIAQWFNSMEITAFILKYRLPSEGHSNGQNVPLMDAERALRLIRVNADEWGIKADKIGVIGFSAGGHLASSLGTLYDKKVYENLDEADQQNARPDFMILIYPVISMYDSITHAGSKKNLLGESPDENSVFLFSTNLQVNNETPSTFIVHATDDKTVIPENSLLFYRALIDANVTAELHMFEKGGHGFGIRDAKGLVSNWTNLCEQWLIMLE